MSDNFEKFIRSNRKAFDTESPSPSVWEQIETGLPQKKEARRFSLRDIYKWSAAAAVLFVALTTIYFLVIRKNSHGTQSADPVVKVNPVENDNRYNAQFDEVYRWIGERRVQLKIGTVRQPELYKKFLADQAALDSSYQALMKQAENSPNQDLIIEAMLQNLRLQAELLSRQLMITNEINNTQKKQSHEKET